ncbi:MAG: ankyrin repeat domain-containing protein [Alphaproteobacteria bacterium]|nr:ankyrin repeat domain-containing protein [Alphaproteobacteria bacterium]
MKSILRIFLFFSLVAAPTPLLAENTQAMALFDAIKNGDSAATAKLLEAGADPNVRDADYLNTTPLMKAVEVKQLKIADMLLEYDADINITDDNGDPAISWAAYFGHADFVDLFLRHGADANISGHGTAREIAMRRGHQAIVKRLTDPKSTPVPSPDVALLIDAIKAGDAASTSDALSFGVSPDSLDFMGRPVLALAARLGNAAVVKRLLLAGAAVDIEDSIGFTPLMEAAREGHIEVVQTLLEAGADPNHRAKPNGLKFAPMHLAALSNKIDMVMLLAGAGSAVAPLDSNDKTPLLWALQDGKIATIAALLRMDNTSHQNFLTNSPKSIKNPELEALLKSGKYQIEVQ